MKILGLYNNPCALELFQWLTEQGHEVVLWTDKLDDSWCREQDFDLGVSYTYRYIIPEKTIAALKNNVVNIHNSVLPFNRGADPNLWSIVDKTPRGVTLHYIDSALDKGYIICQALVNDTDEETLASSYNNLDKAAKQLFKDAFRYYEFWPEIKKRVIGKGSYHSSKDAFAIKSLIDSFDLPITEFRMRLANLNRFKADND
jgi:methionyl-tRNA formyltransferase